MVPKQILAQEISGRLVTPSLNHHLSTSKIIDLDTCLLQQSAFWYAKAKVEVFLSNHADSLFSQTTTDSLGYFRAKIPRYEKCYIKIEGASSQWGEKHLPLYIQNVKQNYNMKIPFVPFLRNTMTLGEYVYVKQKRKFPFQKKRWKAVHNPPEMRDPYKSGKYTFRYKANQCILTKTQKGSEIDFSILAHDEIKSYLKRTDSIYTSQGLTINYQTLTLQQRFPGGEVIFQKFIDKYRKLPQKIPKDTVTYQVKVSLIERSGSIIYPIISKSHDPWHDKEALRLIGMMPKLTPKRSRDPVSRQLLVADINFSYPK
ncbi:hypothetical protein GCM10022397_38740 [Flavivirga jejuensis]